MKKLLIVLLFPIALFSCSKSNDVQPLALVSNNCNAELAKANLTVKEKRSYIQDTFQLNYDSKGMLKSSLSKDKYGAYNIQITASYKDCAVDSIFASNLKNSSSSYQYTKVDQRDGLLPTKGSQYTQVSGNVYHKDNDIVWTYSVDKKTLISYTNNYTNQHPADTYTVNVPSVTNTDLFFVVLY